MPYSYTIKLSTPWLIGFPCDNKSKTAADVMACLFGSASSAVPSEPGAPLASTSSGESVPVGAAVITETWNVEFEIESIPCSSVMNGISKLAHLQMMPSRQRRWSTRKPFVNSSSYRFVFRFNSKLNSEIRKGTLSLAVSLRVAIDLMATVQLCWPFIHKWCHISYTSYYCRSQWTLPSLAE